MKFEQLLQIYWIKGFLFGGDVIPYDETSFSLLRELPGFGRRSLINLNKRISYVWFFKKKQSCLNLLEEDWILINVHFSQIMSIHHSWHEGTRFNAVRLYLIGAFRGLRQADGFPSHGQRTRSNAKNADKVHSIIRSFIADFKKTHEEIVEPLVFNYKKPRKKFLVKGPKYRSKVVKKKTNLWF